MAIQIITWLLFFALFYLIVTSLIFIRNRIELTSLYQEKSQSYTPGISVCIPARNEEDTINTLLHSLVNQTWTQYDVHVLDDESADNTFSIAESYHKKYRDRFFVHKGEKKPDDWLGKPWACHQLAKKCDGEILLFLDADTEVQPDTLEKISASFEYYQLDMLTVWPKQKLVTFWEQSVIPVVYYTLFSLLPSIYVYRDPGWMPRFFRKKFRPKFAAACGQCLAFKRSVYHSVGGYVSVKNKVVDDVELAKIVKKNGYVLRMFSGIGSVSCRMYRNKKELFAGFRKNFLAGFNHSMPLFITAGTLHLIVFVLPFITLFISFFADDSVIFFLSVASVSLILLQRLILAVWYELNPIYSFTHPIGVLWFQFLAVVKIRDYFSGKSTHWKDRKV